jgi:hypothetical protein
MKHLTFAGAFALALLGATTANAATMSAASTTKTPAYAAPVVADADAMKAADTLQHTNLRQQIHDQLSKAGYTAINIMPSSFYIQAKDKKGEPVAMVIGPDSFAEVTEVKTAASIQPKPLASVEPNAVKTK